MTTLDVFTFIPAATLGSLRARRAGLAAELAALDEVIASLVDGTQRSAKSDADYAGNYSRSLPPEAHHPDPALIFPTSNEAAELYTPPPPVPETPIAAAVARPRFFSEERRAVMRQHYPTSRPTRDILDEINALPGPHVTLKQMLIEASGTLKLKRPIPPPAPTPAPLSKAQIMARLATRPSPIAALTAPAEPIRADVSTIIRWGAERGLDQHRLDIEAVNRKRLQLGLSPFQVAAR